MHITSIRVFQVDLPLKEGRYSWAEGKFVDVFDSTLVEICTDSGLRGIGEICPLGPFYLPAFGPGARTAIGHLAPHLLGQDPRELGCINQIMDSALLGHAYAKSALDMACWDLLGRAVSLPVCVLLGGRFGAAIDLYRAISQESPAAMVAKVVQYRAEGYRKFQLKVGGDPQDDIDRIRTVAAVLERGELLMADANCGWLANDAIRVANAVHDIDVYIEQPCRELDKCIAVRRQITQPFILDESIDSIEALLGAHQQKAMDAINLKIAKVGGLTKAKQVRDLCVTLGIPMNIEDSWGGDVTTAAIAHLAHSTPQRYRFAATDFNSYVTVSNASGAPQRVNGQMQASTKPGLGVELNFDVLGDAVAEYGE